MRIILIGTILMFIQVQCIAQEKVLFLQDTKWVHSKFIPIFTNADNLRDISIQYFTESDGTAPQLFVC